ncbi:MAG: hypothetical protein LBQ73_07180 [Tannerellaceae bacterium]|nr:hypothetical protein [Tannerellaceae bacterium]
MQELLNSRCSENGSRCKREVKKTKAKKNMTVKELIEKLSEFPEDETVIIQTEDFVSNEVSDISFDRRGNVVIYSVFEL